MPSGQLYFREQPRRVYVETNRYPHPQHPGDEMVTLRVFQHDDFTRYGWRGEYNLPVGSFNIWSRDLNQPSCRIKPAREE